MVKFLVLVTGFNCKDYVKGCWESIRNQGYANYRAAFISDGSTDGTNLVLIAQQSDPRFSLHLKSNNMGAAYRRWQAVQELHPDQGEVIILVGMDDELLPGCLERIANEYDNGMWMTYGNWINQYGKGLPENFELEFPEEVHKSRDYRKVKYRSTAPNTFRTFLFNRIPKEDFQINGRWIDSTTESEVMFSCLEMCGKEKIGLIRDKIYLYNQSLPGGTLKRLGVKYKYDIYNQIMQRQKKDLLR